MNTQKEEEKWGREREGGRERKREREREREVRKGSEVCSIVVFANSHYQESSQRCQGRVCAAVNVVYV